MSQHPKSHRLLFSFAVLVGFTFFQASSECRAEKQTVTERPNVLFIAVDDLNDWVGCLNGHPQAQTPNIDRLAKRGILFSNAHCASPACNPSRAAIFSGKMPWKTGVWSNLSPKLHALQPDMQLIPHAFKAGGYETLGTGKMMHSGPVANRRMFDSHFDVEQRWSPFTRKAVAYSKAELPSKSTDNPQHVVKQNLTADRVILPLNKMPSDRRPDTKDGESFDWGPLDVPDSAMGDTQITDWAIQQLQAPHDHPFFLGVGYYRPHIPLWAPKEYFERFEGKKIQLPPHLDTDLQDLSGAGKEWALEADTAGLHATVLKYGQWEEAVKAYLACTTYVDAQIGRLLDALDDGKFGDNTIIVLWSDHGWHLGEKQHWGKWTGWERSTRVLLSVVPPKKKIGEYKHLGQVCAQPVSLLDLYPTLLEMCQLAGPTGMDGASLVPHLRYPSTSSERKVVTSFERGNLSLRSTRWRFIRYADGTDELYDLVNDPNEWRNLSKDPQHQTVRNAFLEQIPKEAL